MLPYQTTLWAKDSSSYRLLRRISTLELADENGKSSILGMFLKKTHRSGTEERIDIGTGGPVPAQLGLKWENARSIKDLDIWNAGKTWDEESMRHFEIDGPGGEVVMEVHVACNRRGFKLVTSKGREGCFGEFDDGDGGEVVRAGDGEMVVGLSVCFGNLGGWSARAGTWSHWGMWDFGVVVSKV